MRPQPQMGYLAQCAIQFQSTSGDVWIRDLKWHRMAKMHRKLHVSFRKRALSFSAKESRIIGLLCRKWPKKIRHTMPLHHPVLKNTSESRWNSHMTMHQRKSAHEQDLPWQQILFVGALSLYPTTPTVHMGYSQLQKCQTFFRERERVCEWARARVRARACVCVCVCVWVCVVFLSEIHIL